MILQSRQPERACTRSGFVASLLAGMLAVSAGCNSTPTTIDGPPPSIVFDLAVEGKRAIYRATLDGADLTRVSSTNGDNVHPTVACGTAVFSSFRNGQADLYAVSLHDGVERRITSLTGNETDPVLSADGQRLAFVWDNGGVGRVWAALSDGSQAARVTQTTDPFPEAAPAWSIDGRLLLTSTETGNANLSVATINGTSTVVPLVAANTSSAEVEGAWRADGKAVAFISTRSGSPELYVLNVSSGQVSHIAHAGKNVAQPAWLADGRIVFAVFQTGQWSLAWVDPLGDAAATAIPLPAGNPQHPVAESRCASR